MPVLDLAALQKQFHLAPFIADLGMALEAVAAGECTTTLALAPRHLQQNGVVHAGVLATMADHTAGAAAWTLAAAGAAVMTAEINVSFLRAAVGERLICRARVIKPGRQVCFVEAEVFCLHAGAEQLAAKASATMIVLAPPSP